MLEFINAKINIGLNVVGRRHDGYHLLETCFYPIGRHNGTPDNPEPFCDIIELTDGFTDDVDPPVFTDLGIAYIFSGNHMDCPPEKNLVVRASRGFFDELVKTRRCSLTRVPELTLHLDKHIPDGAGLGGGSADATFTLRLLNTRFGKPFNDSQLENIAVQLGADCPVFVKNRPVFAEGIGEIFSDPESTGIQSLASEPYWALIVKPDLHISTREAFAGLTPGKPALPLREALKLPIEEWRNHVSNDFETSLFPIYPELSRLKEAIYAEGAIYASMTGSGAALYGIFADPQSARRACGNIRAPFRTVCRL